MSNIAIVAIPSKTDQVWNISSEKVPHMTLVHLGNALPKTDFQKVAEWIEHVADTMLHPFWMQVASRDTLGKNDADVLFFKPDEDSSIQLFRKYLLANSAVREAFETVDQFEGWTPHLTLGYPETPAKKVDFTHEFYSVSFNKIALWVGDYEGPEFQLKEEDMAIAMSEEAEKFLVHFGIGQLRNAVELDEIDENLGLSQSDHEAGLAFLAHVGVKGMRWGVRKSAEERRAERTDKIQSRAEKSIARSAELKARAEARTSAADAKAAASTAKLETKVAKKEAKLAKTEARIGVDDPSNAYVRPSSGVAGKTDAESVRLRSDAAKSARTLDDATLKAYTQRIDTEKKLKQAIAEDASPKKAAAKKLINEAGKDLAKTALVGVGSLAIYYALGRMSKTHDIKLKSDVMPSILTKGKASTKDAFSSVEKTAKLAGGSKVPLSEIAKWDKPKSMGPKATPF